MADRIPLIVNPSVNQIQEVPNGDVVTLINNIASTDKTSGALVVTGGVGVGGALNVGDNVDIDGNVDINDQSDSSDEQSGALVVDGGVGIAKKLFVGDDITAFTTSDKKLKDNITPIPNAVDKVLSISGNTFNWNEKSDYEGKADTGVIAQEIEALNLPGVTETRDSGYKAVRYERLVPLLIEAIKELEGRIKTLEG